MNSLIKKFIKASVTYAGSAFMFSIGRQILFLPILNYLNPELFKPISISIVLVDFCSYFLGSSIADYYVRNTKPEHTIEENLILFFKLRKLVIVSLFSFFVFLYYSFCILDSLILSFYLCFFSINTFNLKLFFNKLLFKINYNYILIRLLPLLLFVILVYLYKNTNITLYFLFLLIGEFCFMLYLNIIQNREFKLANYKYLKKGLISLNELKSLVAFVFVYILFSLLQRFDLLVIEKLYSEQYTEYYQMLSIFLIGVNPIILLTSASLLSILTHVSKESFITHKLKLLFVIFSISCISGLMFYFIAPYLVTLLYPYNTYLFEYRYLIFIIIISTINFLMLKTFIIKFVSIKKIILANLIIIIISYGLAYQSIFLFVVGFYFLRFFFYFVLILLEPYAN